MVQQTTEKVFESYLKRILTQGGWLPDTNAEWDNWLDNYR
jgi:hypothetical protein